MRRLVPLLLALWAAAPAHGQAELPDWRVSGFYTLGHAATSSDTGRRFARDQTQSTPDAWAVDSRFGLQVNGPLTPALSGTLQAVLKRRVADTPATHALEWAFLTWSPSTEWQWRLGRTSPDLFLFADVRSVGVAYPWVRPSQEFYAWMPLQSVDGLDVSRIWGNEDATWRLKLSYARGDVRVASQSNGTPGDARLQAVRMLTLSRDTPETRLKLSYLRTRLDLSGAPLLRQADLALAQLQAQVGTLLPQLAREAQEIRHGLAVDAPTQYLALGAQHEMGAWSWTGEWSRIWGQARQTNARRAYVSLARRFDTLSPFVIAGTSRLEQDPTPLPLGWQAQLAPLVGPALAVQATQLGIGSTQAGNLGRMGQHSVGLGLRWDLLPQLALKAQWDHVRVQANGRSLWMLKPGTSADAGFRARVLSLSVNGSF